MSKFIKASFRTIIKFLLSFLLFLNTAQLTFAKSETCGFKEKYPIYLFSGTISATIYRLGLFEDPQIMGLMGMYQFKPTTKKVFAGGIYISQKLAQSIEDNSIIFHEEANDLETTLKQVNTRLKKKWTIHKLHTLNKAPKDLSLEALNIISTYLKESKDCRSLVTKHRAQIEQYQKTLENKYSHKIKAPLIYFFMGQWQGDTPEARALVIYQEGFVLELLKNKIIAPYAESDGNMSYVPWSAKKFFNEKSTYVGIVSELQDHQQSGEFKKIKDRKYQVTCFACLIPGIFQLEWMSKMDMNLLNQ